MKNMNTILSIENLTITHSIKKLFSKKEENVIVNNICLNIQKGEFVALVGESGSGKTITSLSITHLLPKNIQTSFGKILFLKKDLTTLKNKDFQKILGKDISIIFQDAMSSLNPLKKIGHQILEALFAHNKNHLNKKEAKSKVLKILKATGFENPENIYNCYPSELSGGMLQRVLIAMALINKPKLLIADEPTTALDVTTQAQIIKLLFNLNKELDTALLLINHDLSVVSHICSKIYVMYSGEIIESGSTNDVLKNPLHPYTKALVDTIPDLKNKNKKLEVLQGNVPTFEERKLLKCNFYDRCNFRKINNISNKCNNCSPDFIEFEKNHFVKCNLYCQK